MGPLNGPSPEIGPTHYMQPPLGVRVRPRRLAHLRTPLPDTFQPALGSRLATTPRPQMTKVSKKNCSKSFSELLY